MGRTRLFIQRQSLLVGVALLAYLAVRFVTQGDVATAHRNARQVLNFQKSIGLDLELGIQALFIDDHAIITMANWIYIWGYWPVLAFTLIYFGARHREHYLELRNAMFISGAIGLVIFATYAVAPPRLFSVQYIDTVTEHSFFYRVAQPPSLANKYAAIPSFHFGWNLLVAIGWYRVFRETSLRWLSMAMPLGMAFAVVVTANHWIVDVLAGGVVAGAGLLLERYRQRLILPCWTGLTSRLLGPRTDELVLRLDAVEDRPREHRSTRW